MADSAASASPASRRRRRVVRRAVEARGRAAGPPALSPEQVLALRLEGQFLDRPRPAAQLVAVCAAMGGAQAQVGTAARLSLAARLAGLTDADVLRAVHERRTLVKTWTVRGTLHLVPAADLALYRAAIGAVRRVYTRNWIARLGWKLEAVDRLLDDIVEALAGGPLTRREIAARVGEAHGPRARRWLEHSWGGVFHFAVQEGRVCFGPSEGGRITFARIDRWLGQALPERDAAEAEAEMARRYVRAYGPTTVRDFGYWAGMYMPEAQRMWGRIAAELRPVTVAGREAWLHASRRLPRAGEARAVAAGAARDGGADAAAAHVRLLPHFDAYLLGHRDKAAVIEPARYKRVFKNAGWIAPTEVVDGRVAGTWELERGGRGHAARVAAFRPLPPPARAGVAAEAARLADFLGGSVRARYGPPARRKARVAWTGP